MSADVPPPLRALAVRAELRQGGPSDPPPTLIVHDPLGLAGAAPEHLVELDARTWRLAKSFDGRRTVDQLARALAASAEHDAQALAPTVREVWAELSRRGLLRDEIAEERSSRALSEFRALDIRSPVRAGDEYPADAIDLRIQVGGVVADDWDLPPVTAPRALLLPATGFARLRGLYSRGYAALRHAREVRRVLLVADLGAPSARPLVPLTRDAATPMGISVCDREGLAALSMLPGVEELVHRWSPVIERQLPFLQLLFPRAPVLCVLAGTLPESDDAASRDALDDATAALRRVLSLPGRTLLLMACDLSRGTAGAGAAALESELAEAAVARDTELIRELTRRAAPDPPTTTARPAGLAPLVLGLEALAEVDSTATGVRLGSERTRVNGEARVGLTVLYR